jgi:hypothetical protein
VARVTKGGGTPREYRWAEFLNGGMKPASDEKRPAAPRMKNA